LILPVKTDIPIKDGYLLEASSKDNKIYSCSLASESTADANDGVLGDEADSSAFDSLDSVFEFFLVFGGICY
jgi:hypothetical protein